MRKIRFWFLVFGCLLLVVSCSMAELTFYLIDNFESGSTSKWFPFGSIDVSAVANPLAKAKDLVAESCGSYMLKVKGSASDWYVGGIGTDLMIDASSYKRLQMDIYGSALGGKLRIELYDEDNGNNQIEADKNWQPLYDDKWAVEIPILGPGFTRISVPFTAFTLDNPGKGDGLWNPATKNGSSGLTRMQIVFVAKEKTGKVDVGLDNVLLTY